MYHTQTVAPVLYSTRCVINHPINWPFCIHQRLLGAWVSAPPWIHAERWLYGLWPLYGELMKNRDAYLRPQTCRRYNQWRLYSELWPWLYHYNEFNLGMWNHVELITRQSSPDICTQYTIARSVPTERTGIYVIYVRILSYTRFRHLNFEYR